MIERLHFPYFIIPLGFSLAAHFGLAVWLSLQMASHQVSLPLGVEWRHQDQGESTLTIQPLESQGDVVRRLPVKKVAPKMARRLQSGVSAKAGPIGVVDGKDVSAIERYKSELRLYIESHKTYPEFARRQRQTGAVMVQFRVTASGELKDVLIQKKSKYDILNQAAIDLIRTTDRFHPFPKDWSIHEMVLLLPIEYVL